MPSVNEAAAKMLEQAIGLWRHGVKNKTITWLWDNYEYETNIRSKDHSNAVIICVTRNENVEAAKRKPSAGKAKQHLKEERSHRDDS